MSMKKTVIISVLAAAVSTSAVGAVSAAPAATASTQVTNSTFYVNDAVTTVRTIVKDGVTLVSVRDLGVAAGAIFTVTGGNKVLAYLNDVLVELQEGSATARIGSEEVELGASVVNVNNSFYADLTGFASALGIDQSTDAAGSVWLDATKRLADAEDPIWIDAQTLLVSTLTEDGSRVDYKVNAATGEFKEVFRTSTASPLTVAPNGAKAAYTDETGAVYVLDLTTNASTKASSDDTIKPELVWSADSSAIYFLQGDKGSVIAKLNPADGTITKVLEDKVDYKADLAVSEDGKRFVYSVTKPGAVTADANKPVDSDDVAIDMTGTEPQLYFFDSSAKDGKPAKLTEKADDKIFVGASADAGQVYYISSEENKVSSLIAVSADKSVKSLLEGKDVLQATAAGDKLYALVATATGGEVYEIQGGSAKLLYAVSEDVSEIVAGKGTPVAVVEGSAIAVNKDGKWKKVTK
ncbi:stalk domain-containing protein [Paenibacillus aurantiacus]|uniref:Stalk domain-containing protein n=1 Tax=Paenibacillus aurantiacus TaxID=1936118 RepID=A0ABV5KY66_9BACL